MKRLKKMSIHNFTLHYVFLYAASFNTTFLCLLIAQCCLILK